MVAGGLPHADALLRARLVLDGRAPRPRRGGRRVRDPLRGRGRGRAPHGGVPAGQPARQGARAAAPRRHGAGGERRHPDLRRPHPPAGGAAARRPRGRGARPVADGLLRQRRSPGLLALLGTGALHRRARRGGRDQGQGAGDLPQPLPRDRRPAGRAGLVPRRLLGGGLLRLRVLGLGRARRSADARASEPDGPQGPHARPPGGGRVLSNGRASPSPEGWAKPARPRAHRTSGLAAAAASSPTRPRGPLRVPDA